MDSFIPELRFTKTCREREGDWDWSRIEYEGLYGFDLSDPHDRSEGMSSCLRLPLVTAGGSEILVHMPVRKASPLLPLPLRGAIFHPARCLAQSQACRPSGHFSCDPHGT